MHRFNRGRIIGLGLTIFIIYFLFLSSTNTNPSDDFRRKTEEGIARRHGILRGDLSDEALTDQTNRKLQEILAKNSDENSMQAVVTEGEGQTGKMKAGVDSLKSEAAGAAGEKPTGGEKGDDSDVSVAGRKSMPKEKGKPKYPVQPLKENFDDKDEVKAARKLAEEREREKAESAKDPIKEYARAKLQEYLKKPVIIFSKSYCPHSKRAKQLMLDIYTIVPTPTVVELDQLTEIIPIPDKPTSEKSDHDEDETSAQKPQVTLGKALQDLLGEMTGRRTVPNIMVGMHSIGGNDLIWDLHEQGLLADEVRKLGGKRVLSVDVGSKD